MWGDPNPDPGGNAPEPQTSKEINDLKDQNEQQQLLIAQLKEMLRKEQSTVPQEKVEEYFNTLSKAKAKKSKTKKDDSVSTERSSSGSVDSKKHERVNLMKQQLEENKAKLAERGMRQKNLEDMVTVLKAQLSDTSQQPKHTAPSLEKNLEYNKNTSPEELYNILLVKDKRIIDLFEKNQKQEANILDLQENLKEKDSVIDARTKAISLMTENLSKKGKDTLDSLDETKEQMRKMQENFVTLESEMKARQMILLNDLKSKNLEISDLQEEIDKLIQENNKIKNTGSDKPESDNHELIIKDLKSKLEDSKSIIEENKVVIEEFKIKIIELEAKLASTGKLEGQNQTTEIEKLKKQLDESNKNMIKVKAQSKSKIKDLNKKLDGFKKMSDANATIIQLQNEITKLNEKIAELEEEKGNMQLKMVESFESIKGSTHSEDLRDLQEKLDRNLEDMEEKDKVISLLESDIISLKTEVKDLNDKMSGFSQLKNEQVTSEIQSIEIEEQMEIIKTTNTKLQSEIKTLRDERDVLIEKIEEVSKEKLELTAKLDSYIQENMELIDKLEKLSAEKVSSAESIEIVEGLTQQEKLELAAYQTNMDTNLEDPVKPQEEEPPAELNESVLQLTEETAELLKKIEMFNMERKEVMIKLESIREENNQLTLKLNEVENNRDILAETYEQVQTEKDELVKENEEIKQKLIELENNKHSAFEDSDAILQHLQKEYERILKENDNLKKSLKEFDSKIHEKDNLESELFESKAKINELESKLKENIEEITNYQLIIEENKTEFINSSEIINKLQNKLEERENDINELNTTINDLNNSVTVLQQANSKLSKLEIMEKQVEELKASLIEQVEQAEEFREELTFNKTANEKEIENKDREIHRLKQEIAFKEETINTLKDQLKEKDQSVTATIEEMKQKYLILQKQLNTNSGTLEKQIEDLSTKNKEQLEKMKKIAANLKRKNQAYQELEQKFNGEKEKWETEVNKKETDSKQVIIQLSKEVEELKREITSKSLILETSEIKIHELSNAITNLEQQNVDLQNMLLEARQKQEKISDVSLKQELSTSLHEEFDNLHGSKESINEDKIKEMQLIIEMNEGELIHYKERSKKLEEDLAALLEEKEELLNKTKQLEERFSLMSKSIEEKSLLEEEMDHKLQEVAANDEVLARRVEELTKENKELTDKTREQEELVMKLKIKVKKVQDKIIQMKTLQSSLEEQEQANTELKKQISHLETLQKQIQLEYEEKEKQNQKDYERIESDYQLQLEGLVKSRNDLTFECEKLQEEVKLVREKEEELIADVNENNQRLSDVHNQYNNQIAILTENLNKTSANWQESKEKIETLQAELDAQLLAVVAKNTIDTVILDAKDKVFIANSKETQTENIETVTTQQQQSNDWFTEAYPRKHAVNVTKEDLENKIKALEILLYNVDQEKEEVIRECSDMLNELTHLVYEKIHNVGNINLSTAPSVGSLQPLSDLESEIMSSQEIDAQKDSLKLHELEFEETNRSLGQQHLPVEDKFGPPSTAYLTYQPFSEVESQILSRDMEIDPLKLQQLEFERCDPLLGHQSHPVVERLAQPTKAYLTYQVGEAIGENDDGWGWGPEEAKLEEEHQYRTENTPQVQALKAEVEQLQGKIQLIQTEKDNYLEEIKQLQVKYGKLVKKCKELKVKHDQLLAKAKPDTDFFDLEQTIQEELKRQIEQLETKIKELSSELDKDKQDKSNLLKKVDVLISANEKLVEMNQIQDSEIYRWKRKYEEVQERLDHLDWGNESPKKQPKQSTEDTTEDVEDLKKLIQDLTVDNEELQALLNDQKQQRVQFERSRSIGNEERIKNLEEDLLNKESLINRINEEKRKDIEDIHKQLEERNLLVQNLHEQLNELHNKENQIIIDNKNTVSEEKLKQTEKVLAQVQSELERNDYSLKESAKELERLQSENEELRILLKEKENQLENNVQLEDLKILLMEKTALADQFQHSNDSLNQEISDLRNQLDNLKQEFINLQTNTNEMVITLQNHKQEITVEDVIPSIQELTQFKANSIKELVDQFNHYESLKMDYDQITNSYGEKINELEHELINQKQQYQNLQAFTSKTILDLQKELEEQKQNDEFTSKNILDLQKELEEQKQNADLLQVENVNKLKSISDELENERRKHAELLFPSEKVDTEKTQHLSEMLNEKEENIRELEALIEELRGTKSELEGKMKDILNSKQQELDIMENKLVDTIAELEDKWAAQVDERGNTVAESWKYHLSIVESDFSAREEKFKNEINELEEKCNALVNENNELRKNVDTEIKNEVDRISALQQQINDRQHVINEFKQLLASEQTEKAGLIQQVSELNNSQQLLAVELASLKTLAETTRQQFDEKREVVEEIVKILECNTSFPLSCDKKDILNEIQRQLSLSADANQELDKLNSELQNINKQLHDCTVAIQEKDAELLTIKESYEKQVFGLKEEITQLKNKLEQLRTDALDLGHKDGEIARLESLAEDYKVQLSSAQQETQNLQQLYNQSHLEVENYKQHLQEFSQNYASLQHLIEEKNQQITSLNQQINDLNLHIGNLSQQLQISTDNKETEKIESELTHLKEAYLILQQSLADCQQQLFNITQDLATKSHEFETVSQQLAYSQQNADLFQEEINKLTQTLHIKEQEYAVSLENIGKTRYNELENHYEEVLSAKDLDIQTLRSQVAEYVYNISENMKLRSELEERIKQLELQITELSTAKSELESKILEQTSLSGEESKQLNEMRSIIEEQVVKIEELKKELFGKSNDYDSLIAEMDISRNAITQQPTASGSRAENPSAAAERSPIPEDDLSEPVNRAELDLALYMLHQRDVRCEELTVELTHLLEERDTLQLRLSNAIREKEEFKRNLVGTSGPTEVVASIPPTEEYPGTPKSSKTSAIFLAASGTELASEPTEKLTADQDLASKLSELKIVGYKKDKTFVDEQQQRRLQQLSIMQQHIKEASKLPPEAAAKLVDASYTLSRDVQSPSKVLLNWLWGRSTPRVNDT